MISIKSMRGRRGDVALISIAAICIIVTGFNRRKTPGTGDPIPVQARTLSMEEKRMASAPMSMLAVAPQRLIEIIEFSDFQCPFCKRMAATLAQVEEDFPGQVQIGYRHFPLTGIHSQAMAAAVASECAAQQSSFRKMHDLIFERQDLVKSGEWPQLAVLAGLSSEKFNACVASGAADKRIDMDLAAAKALRLEGTPMLVIDGVLIESGMTAEQLKSYLDSVVATRKTTGM